ncbi:MAG: phosphotransferase enzyme family protein [Anaerolineae bacterium]
MKAYTELTRLGKIRRQRKLVYKALEAYDLNVSAVHFLADHTNTLFRVETEEGKRYALRIYSDGETTIKENRAEMFWLNALMRDTDLKITEPVARKDGELLSVINLDGLPPDQRCALFRWIPGRPLANKASDLSPENYFRYGQAQAKLHNHAETLNPLPADITPKKWDKVFYYPNEPIVYNQPEYSHLFPAERVVMLDKVVAKADTLLGRLFEDQAGQILIHGDLHYWNIHIDQGELYLIDFEDVNLGYDLQDVAITLYYIRDRDDYQSLKKALQDGYSTVRPWPIENDEVVETLIAARKMMFTNYVAHLLPESDAREMIDGWCEWLASYLESYD